MTTDFLIQSSLGSTISESANPEELQDFIDSSKDRIAEMYPEDEAIIEGFNSGISVTRATEASITVLEEAYNQSIAIEQQLIASITTAERALSAGHSAVVKIIGVAGGTQPPYPAIGAYLLPLEKALEKADQALEKQKQKTVSLAKEIDKKIEELEKQTKELAKKISTYIKENFALKQIEPDQITV